jgi:hypothetical protein
LCAGGINLNKKEIKMGYLLVVFLATMLAGFFSGYGKRRPSGVNSKSATPARVAQDGSWVVPTIGKGGKPATSKSRPEKSSPVNEKKEHQRQTVFLSEGDVIRGVILNMGKTSRYQNGRSFPHFRVILGLAGGDTAILWGEDLQRALIGLNLGDEVEIKSLGSQPVEVDGSATMKRLYQARKI